MNITIDALSPEPPFEQIRSAVTAAVRAGDVIVGTKLPTVRALAEQLGLATNTVARAYRELESDGVIETRGRNGSVVLASGDSIHRSVEKAAREYADLVAGLGISPEDALAIVRVALLAT